MLNIIKISLIFLLTKKYFIYNFCSLKICIFVCVHARISYNMKNQMHLDLKAKNTFKKCWLIFKKNILWNIIIILK